MPKLKSNRSAAKRFKVTGKGKVKTKRAFMRHILGKKAKKRKRKLRRPTILTGHKAARIKRLVPYS